MKLLFGESLSPRLVPLLHDLFPESEGARHNGLARIGDRRILVHMRATHLAVSRMPTRLKAVPGYHRRYRPKRNRESITGVAAFPAPEQRPFADQIRKIARGCCR